MLQYFEQQLKTAPPLGEDGAAAMIKVRVDNGGNEAELTEYFTARLGQRLVFALLETDNNLEVKRMFEGDIVATLSEYTYDANKSSVDMPRFYKR